MFPKRRHYAWVAVVLIAVAALAVFFLSARRNCLVLSDEDTGRIYAAYPLAEGGTFSVTFEHSVNKSDVTDVYEIRRAQIYAVALRYSAFGAGMPTALEEGWVLTSGDGVMTISGIDTKMDRLCYVVATVYDHTLEINGKAVNLRELCGRNSAVVFEYRKMLLLKGDPGG